MIGPDTKKWTPNDWADFYRDTIGVNVIPADSRNKRSFEEWSKWQNSPISQEQHEEWKKIMHLSMVWPLSREKSGIEKI